MAHLTGFVSLTWRFLLTNALICVRFRTHFACESLDDHAEGRTESPSAAALSEMTPAGQFSGHDVVYGTVGHERKTEQVATDEKHEHDREPTTTRGLQTAGIKALSALRTTTKLKSILKQANPTATKAAPGAYWSASSDSATRKEPSEVDIVRAEPDNAAGRHFRDGPTRSAEEQVKLEASRLGAPEGATEARRRSFVRFSEINSVMESD